jgi:putative methyltransferase (TIGR04325 family)
MYFILKQLAPPILKTLKNYSYKYGWKGNYKSFESAKKHCKGYDEEHILKRISLTTAKVKNGEAAYERDGIIYEDIKINSPVLNNLLRISAENDNKLTIIDFGGSLGTSYYQNIPFLKHLKELNWCIIEQEHYVKEGRSSFENEQLKFYETIEDCVIDFPTPNLLLISGSIQYVKRPYELLSNLQQIEVPYILLDYIGYNPRKKDRITVQYVPPVFYGIDASYPCLFFDRLKLENQLKENYEKVYEFNCDSDTFYLELIPFKYEGSFWKLRDN